MTSCLGTITIAHRWSLIVYVRPQVTFVLTQRGGPIQRPETDSTWWRHQMETFSALLAICAVPGEFPAQRPVARSFDVFFDLRLNKQLSKQSWGGWFETLSCPLWRHCYDVVCDVRRHHNHVTVIHTCTNLLHNINCCILLAPVLKKTISDK